MSYVDAMIKLFQFQKKVYVCVCVCVGCLLTKRNKRYQIGSKVPEPGPYNNNNGNQLKQIMKTQFR